MIAAAFLGVVMGLYAVAVHVGRIIAIHNLTVEAHTLRRDYTRKLAALRGEIEGEQNFEYVDEGGGTGPAEAIEIDSPAGNEAKKAA